ncbi:cytochrome b5 domain-containing protein [Abyssisolibacter fermentans]|uniref:cytochrome b5 domain-containing protein n=1 Tax=Abyssisolibacter fermentans TaxID=1766203 RepID=UPI0008330C38|nr:cytochrome b5 domain-containing protein [Abyssisolibacter fermentans]
MEKNLKKIKDTVWRLLYLQRMEFSSPFLYYQIYYNKLLMKEINKLLQEIDDLVSIEQMNTDNQRKFTLKELAENDGSNGKPAYVAINGIVYDVSTEITWGGGTHFGLYAGNDLTEELKSCHEMQMIIKKLTQVGILKK